MISPINFFYAPKTLQKRRLLKSFLEKKIVQKKRCLLIINFYFFDKKQHLALNKQSLNHNYDTDIITFSFNAKNNVGGDIYINIDEVKNNAVLYNCSLKDELHRVLFHGVLHLLDYNDKTKIEQETMKKQENIWIKEYKEYV